MRCEVLIDWLTFTVKVDDPNIVIRDYLGMEPDLFTETGLSLMGYQRVLNFGDIKVCYEGRENAYFSNMGVCVSMSGNGCRTFETYSRLVGTGDGGAGSVNFMQLFEKLDGNEKVHVTRLDVACDEREGALDMEKIIEKVSKKEVNSRLKKRRVVLDMDGKEDDGQTVYFGAPSSDFRIRIYDKAKEQGLEGHWIRVEMVLKGKHGGAFIGQLVTGQEIGQLAAQVMNDKFSFIELTDSNISRCPVCDWWLSFVDEVGKVRLVCREVIQHSVEQLAEWVNNQLGPTLYIIAETLGFTQIYDFAQASKDRLNRKQEALINDWKNVQRAARERNTMPVPVTA